MHEALSWSFEERDARRVDALLASLLDDTRALRAFLIDRTGQLISSAGPAPRFDPTSFASLAAADFAANEQLAAMLGEREFSSLFHQGPGESVYLLDLARRAVLVVVFDATVTLGLVRIKAKRAVPALASLIEEVFTRPVPAGAAPRLDAAWASEADDEVDRVFGGL